MKKSLLALAAMGAFAGAAQAQSSVTVYGVLDMGYIGSNSREPSTVVPGGSNKIQKSAFGQSAETTSRLGFRGTEDLGGGMRAFFTVELGLTPQNSNLSGGTAEDRAQRTTQGSGSAIDNRQSFVGLGQKGIGQFAFGRQYTPVFVAGAATSAGQYNNVIGDVVYAGASSVWASGATQTLGTNNGITFTNRASNALTIQTDRFGGFVLSGMYAMNNQDATLGTTAVPGTVCTAASTSTCQGGNTNWNMYGIGGDFRWQKLIVTAAYQSFKTQYSTGVYNNTANVPLALGGTVPTTAISAGAANVVWQPSQIADKQTLVGATYDFGIVKAYAQWVGRKIQNDYGNGLFQAAGAAAATAATGEQFNRTAQQIGVRGNATKTIEYWATVGSGRIKSSVGGATANFTGYQLGSNYNLSKRTNLYAIFGAQNTSSTTSLLGGANANQYAVGARHTF